jgi:uncharacterized protein YjdB
MPFTFKLSKRLALMKASLLPALAVALGACQLQDRRGLTGPTLPEGLARLAISPQLTLLRVNQTSDFTVLGLTQTGDTAPVDVSFHVRGPTRGRMIGISAPRLGRAIGHYQAGATPGQDSVIALDSSGVADTAVIVITPVPVASVTVTPATATVQVGKVSVFRATPHDSTGNPLTDRVVTWKSSDPAAVTVSPAGVATGVVVGSASIIATSEGKSDTSLVTVTNAPVASVTVSPASASVLVGATQEFSAVTKDSDGNTLTGRVVTWTSSDPAAVAVSATGIAIGVTKGSASIIATSEGNSGTASITVTNVRVASVTVIPVSASIVVGGTQQLTAATQDSAGTILTGRVVTWASSNPAVAAVSSSGLVTGLAAGTATITAMSEGKSGSSTITVTNVPVASVDVTPALAAIQAGETVQLTATPTDAAGNPLPGRAVSWASSAPAVATVSGSGLVTGKAAGVATISAMSEGVGGTAAVTVTNAVEGTYYVAPTGSDANPGTAAAPFRTIQKAASLVNPGDVVIVEDGEWTEFFGSTQSIVEIARGGAPGKLVTFKARNRWGAKLSGRGGAKAGFNLRSAIGWVRIEGFDIFGMSSTAGSATGIEMYGGGQSSEIVGNHIHDIGRICTQNPQGQDGIYVERADITIEGNVIHDIGRFAPGESSCTYSAGYFAYQSNDHGIYVSTGNGVLIRNNVFYNHRSGWAVHAYPNARANMRLLNNTFAFGNPWKDYTHILLAANLSGSSIIANNIFYDPAGGRAIDVTYLSGAVSFSNNLTSGSAMTRGTAPAGVTLVANKLNTDPLLVNPSARDFQLRAGSPAIDAGLSLPQVLMDFDARLRPRGAGYDLGAYEF